jgi:hypothetical protein
MKVGCVAANNSRLLIQIKQTTHPTTYGYICGTAKKIRRASYSILYNKVGEGSMIISDLNYLQQLPVGSNCLAGGFASVNIDVSSSANGAVTFTFASAESVAKSLPYGGSFAFGGGVSYAFAYNPPSFPKFPDKYPK